MLRAKRGRYRIAAATQLLKSRDANCAGECETEITSNDREKLEIGKQVMAMSAAEIERHLADFGKRPAAR